MPAGSAMSDSSATAESFASLSAEHGLEIDPASVRVEEVGLDYRVAFARTAAGEEWVLRVPRRPDVAEGIPAEAAILDLVGPRLSVEVPDWRIRSERLIAYPLLPGRPGLTVDAASGEPVWAMEPTSRVYARAFGELLAELHSIDRAEAAAAGMTVEEPEQVRAWWSEQVGRMVAAFDVAPHLLARWRAWIGDDSYWPAWSVVTHGEIYPAHVLIDAAERPTAVLDWTTAKVSDPGRDFATHHMVCGPEAFALTLTAYESAGGRTWPHLAEHCAELIAAGPVGYGSYALTTGEPEHLATAQALLDPQDQADG